MTTHIYQQLYRVKQLVCEAAQPAVNQNAIVSRPIIHENLLWNYIYQTWPTKISVIHGSVCYARISNDDAIQHAIACFKINTGGYYL